MSKYDIENKKLKETMPNQKEKDEPFFIGEVAEDTIEKKALAKWKSLTISSDFVFCKVMQDKELLKELLERIFPQLSIIEIEVEPQKTIDVGPDIHGVRFDIFVTLIDGTTVDIEMQVLDTGYLPKRIRYNGSMMDAQMLDKGILYSKLSDSYVIMICPFDLFGLGRHIYTFKYMCVEAPSLELGDGTTKIVLNASGTLDDIDHRLKVFLDYVAGESVDDEYIRRLDKAVRKAKLNKIWRREYMTLYMRDLEQQEIGEERGKEIGKEIGKEGEQKTRILYMLNNGKTPQEITDFCGYPITLVNEVKESMMTATH